MKADSERDIYLAALEKIVTNGRHLGGCFTPGLGCLSNWCAVGMAQEALDLAKSELLRTEH